MLFNTRSQISSAMRCAWPISSSGSLCCCRREPFARFSANAEKNSGGASIVSATSRIAVHCSSVTAALRHPSQTQYHNLEFDNPRANSERIQSRPQLGFLLTTAEATLDDEDLKPLWDWIGGLE